MPMCMPKRGFNPTQATIDNQVKLEAGEAIFLKEQATNWLSVTINPECICISNIMCTVPVIFRRERECVCVCVCVFLYEFVCK